MFKDVRILVEDGCTEREAMEHLDRGTLVIPDFEENFDFYMAEWCVNGNDIDEYRYVIETGNPNMDMSRVTLDGNNYYILYCL